MAPSPFDPKNVQGDVLAGLPKKTETFVFFRIDDAHMNDFRKHLTDFAPMVTTCAQVVSEQRPKIAAFKRSNPSHSPKGGAQIPIGADKPKLVEIGGINIAFTAKGLKKMRIPDVDKIGDQAFLEGMQRNAVGSLGDTGSKGPPDNPSWISEFKQEIHGVFLITGDTRDTTNANLARIRSLFGSTIHEIKVLIGETRPGKEDGHEHFGFLDGVSQPAVQGFDKNLNPGQSPAAAQGIFLMGREKDTPDSGATRPIWALDGSILAFRYLFQLVPEFDDFLTRNALQLNDPTANGKELLGARMVGRWKSGAPVDVKPLRDDDPTLGTDKSRNDNFSYDPMSQDRCPFAAHTRKTNPRSDLGGNAGTEQHRILRRGIQFGPEVTSDEWKARKTQQQRGLLFACYQSNTKNGFQFIQQSWANNQAFIFGKKNTDGSAILPGFDPIIGQSNGGSRAMVGTKTTHPEFVQKLDQEWVTTGGGEYFFVPSLPVLRSFA